MYQFSAGLGLLSTFSGGAGAGPLAERLSGTAQIVLHKGQRACLPRCSSATRNSRPQPVHFISMGMSRSLLHDVCRFNVTKSSCFPLPPQNKIRQAVER